ncbi:MAG: DUF3109 family protein [Cyclobacteriaceae bacterium]|nr:DUF3109 family protein [Cyclobacteriaceae bacterium]MCH8516540.1 DUF3109 family protein [Cyclobacteriaceae bacterium]
MLALGNTLISEELKNKMFVCNIEACKGACCVEGDLGAPLEKKELAELEKHYEQIAPYLSEAGKKAIQEQGKYVLDFEDEYSTPTVDNKECAYAIYDENEVLKCGIEQAYRDGKIPWMKPISCHLYPVRITKQKFYDALNYDKWHICSAACTLGEELGVPIYKFVKDALIRKYGEKWYADLEEMIQAYEAEKKAN